MIQEPFCSGPDCGNAILAPIVFVTFMIFSSMLILDLIVAIVLNQFENELRKEKRLNNAFLSESDIIEFSKLWSECSGGKLKMPIAKLTKFLNNLKYPWIKSINQNQYLYTFLDDLQLPCSIETVHYLDVIHQLAEKRFYELYPNSKPKAFNNRIQNHYQDNNYANNKHNNGLNNSNGNDKENNNNYTDISNFSSSFYYLSTGGIPLANEDLKLIRASALKQFSTFKNNLKWIHSAGFINRIILIQKLIRGYLGRKHSPVNKQKMIKMQNILLLRSSLIFTKKQ